MKTSRKRPAAAARTSPNPQPPADDRMVILVRRGALRRFDALKQKTTELPVVISWDRRQQERRRAASAGSVERRQADRRQLPPFTWELADFVVLPGRAAGSHDVGDKGGLPTAAAPAKKPRPRTRARGTALKAVSRKTSRRK